MRAAGRCVTSLPPRVCSRHMCVISYVKLKQLQVTAASGGQEGRQEDGDGQPELRWSLRNTPHSGPRGRGREPQAHAQLGRGWSSVWLRVYLSVPASPHPQPSTAGFGSFPSQLGVKVGCWGREGVYKIGSDAGGEIWPKNLLEYLAQKWVFTSLPEASLCMCGCRSARWCPPPTPQSRVLAMGRPRGSP